MASLSYVYYPALFADDSNVFLSEHNYNYFISTMSSELVKKKQNG